MGIHVGYGHTILVVDEVKNYRFVLTRLFSGIGYRVLTAENKEECLNILKSNPVDLVVTDLQLAGSDGFELYRAIRMLTGGVPCLVFSSDLSSRSLLSLNETGMIGYMSKPFDNNELLHRVENLLASTEKKGRTVQTFFRADRSSTQES